MQLHCRSVDPFEVYPVLFHLSFSTAYLCFAAHVLQQCNCGLSTLHEVWFYCGLGKEGEGAHKGERRLREEWNPAEWKP